MKRLSSDSDSTASGSKRRKVSYTTYQKWKSEMDKDFSTLTWLDCETSGTGNKKTVEKLKCTLCTKYESNIECRRNYSSKWVTGADSVRTSNIKDHFNSDQHTHAMMLLKKSQCQNKGLDVATYAPIAKAFSEISDDDKKTLKVKFDIAHFVATHKLAFTHYPSICQLEEKHGVHVGTAYRNQNAGKDFCHFIAASRREELKQRLVKAQFFSILMDGSTDVASVDDEMFLVLWCDIDDDESGTVLTNMSYFTIRRPKSVDAKGLFECLQESLCTLGIHSISSEQCKLLVGIGTDGASANIAGGGLKGLIEKEIPWLYWSWCLAHRVELAVKDALKGTSFDLIDEMLLRLYYIYEKSPKKCRQLEEVITDLIQFDDSGIKPVRASGSRWISHKLSAMKRVLSKFGAYSSHFVALSEDSTVKAADRAKLCGYVSKWVDAKYILGCAFFSDLLSPCAIFSKVLQSDSLDILAFTSLLRTVQELDKLSTKTLNQWPSYSATCKSITEEDGKKLYQQQALRNHAGATEYFKSHCDEICSSVSSCLRSRLRWTDMQFVRDVILFLATQGWQKLSEAGESGYSEAIVRLYTKFTVPLEAVGVVVGLILSEFNDMLSYADQFISLSTTSYQSVWWKLFHSPNSSDWTNVLTLARLLFTLPVSNGKLERVFSTMKNIKLEKRSSMGNEILDDLLTLNIDMVSIETFTADHSIDLWWRAKARRPNQQARKQYVRKPRHTQEQEEVDTSLSDSDTDTDDLLKDWDKWTQDF